MTPDSDDRTAAQVRREGNRLRGEASLYLQQHAGNPVDWFPWGEDALARARALDRPVFLSSGYSSCHWCHVMEHEVFEHDDVADLLNHHFVSIKVDREESPEVDATYMDAVQAMTGRGGWPMSVFLTPAGRPFFGGTYFPRAQFRSVLEQIVRLWADRRGDVDDQAAALAARIQAEPVAAGPGGDVGADLCAAAAADAAERFDDVHGGFAAPMKFPMPVRWRFLLHWYRKTGDPTSRRMVEATLDAMGRGGLYDHVGGGFHRYTVDPDWTVPHFEKMLYDNAQLASLYLEAGVALARPDFIALGVDTLEFLEREMCGPEGAIYASLDADSGGEEGTYYVWTPAQLAVVAGDDAPALAAVLGVTDSGNFEGGASVVTRRANPVALEEGHGLDAGAAAALFERHRPALLAARATRAAPGLDRKIITGWNGLAMSAFARGAMATGRDDLADRAAAIASHLQTHGAPDGRLARASNAGRLAGVAVLEDHALLARGLVDLFQVTGDAAHLAWARELVANVREQFAREAGAWYTTTAEDSPPLGRRVDLFDNVIPSGCSVMLDVLLDLGALGGDLAVPTQVRRELAAQAPLLERAGLEMAGWLDALLRLDGPLRVGVVAGDPTDEACRALRAAVGGLLSPGVVLAPVPGRGPDDALVSHAPVTAGKVAGDLAATAFVCEAGSCSEPTSNPMTSRDLAREGWVG